jgi:D-glycero-alpha-D-manno-heptose-7-phosphate kinase
MPSYYRSRNGGFVVAAAITKYVFIAVNRNFDEELLLKYSQIERVRTPLEAQHPLLREILVATGFESGIEISSMADIPAGTGLGSSGAFTVGTLNALRAHRRELVSNLQLAEQACCIEIDRLSEPIGKQDQYIAAVGGITAFEFSPDDSVTVSSLELAADTRHRLEENLLLFFTGIRRSASHVLATEMNAADTMELDLAMNLDAVKALGRDAAHVLAKGDLDSFGELLTAQWDTKLHRSPTRVHRQADDWIRAGINAGAVGGKLVGAGDGGFLLFYAVDKTRLRETMTAAGLDEVRFGVDYRGTNVIVDE